MVIFCRVYSQQMIWVYLSYDLFCQYTWNCLFNSCFCFHDVLENLYSSIKWYIFELWKVQVVNTSASFWFSNASFDLTEQTVLLSSEMVNLVVIVWWWSSNLSVLWNSTYSKTYISGMYQLAGHSWKILHGVFCHRLV